MMKTFALCPEVAISHPAHGMLADSFGPSSGRWIGKIPGNYFHALYARRELLPPIQSAKFEEALKRLQAAAIDAPGVTYDETESWGQNIINHDWAFDGIVTDDAIEHDKIIRPSNMDDGNPLWTVPRTMVVQRTPAKIADALLPLAQNAKQIAWIDPYFTVEADDGPSGRFLDVFCDFIQKLNTRVAKPIELHVRCRSSDLDFEGKVRRRIPSRLPHGWKVSIQRLKENGHERLHARYMLTERGGINIEGGLDAGTGTSDFSLLDTAHHLRRWNQYMQPSAFAIDGSPIDVHGPI